MLSESFNNHCRCGTASVADTGTTFLSRLEAVYKVNY